MSRETLDGGAAADTAAPAVAGTDLDLAVDDRPAERGPDSPPAPAPPVRRRLQVLRTAAAALVVAALAGAFATVAEQRRTQAGAADEVRLLGAFVPGGSFVESASSDPDSASISGLLSLVNAGPHPVELLAATVSGVPTRQSVRQRRIEPGGAVEVHTTLDVPCSQPVDDRVEVEVRVLANAGQPGQQQRETVGELPAGTFFPLADQVTAICSGNGAFARVTRMEVNPDGTVGVDLEAVEDEDEDVQLRVLLAPRMGALVNGDTSVTVVVPPDAEITLTLQITIEDCEQARESVGATYDVLNVEAGVEQSGEMGYVDGWQPSVGIAAFGFALARQC